MAGFAPTMEILVVGRLIQGLGTGGQTVALYVVVARVYPPAIHGRVFAAFSAAWVIPSLVGPFLAGAVAEYLHWRWVFLGVALLTVVAFTMVVLRLHGQPLRHGPSRDRPRRCRASRAQWPSPPARWRLSLAGELGTWSWLVVAASVLIIGLAVEAAAAAPDPRRRHGVCRASC